MGSTVSSAGANAERSANGKPAAGAAKLNFDLVALVESAALRWPQAPAIQFEDQVLKYAELNQQANRLAHWLIRTSIAPDDLVGLSFARIPEALIAILGVLKAGAAYVPFDPQYPAERLAIMLEDAQPRLMLTDDERITVPTSTLTKQFFWDRVKRESSQQSCDNPASRASGSDLGYVLFTSGSTGRPKGIAMPRGPLLNLINWQMRHSCAGPGDATLQFASLSFDVSFQEVFSTWATGGVLVIPSPSQRRDPTVLLQLIDRRKIKRIFVPFIMLQQLCEATDNPPSCLREIVTAGEQLQVTEAVRRFFTALPHCSLHNQYGPTEAHVVTAHTLSGPASEWPTLPPIGRPIEGARIHLMSESAQPNANGREGEIWISGSCLARGFLGRPELTSERFVEATALNGARAYRTGDLGRWNERGELEFLGRIDNQVKVRGFRVEPGEIEAALCARRDVREAVVVAREDRPGDRRLVAYFVSNGHAPDVSQLRVELSKRLPEFMVPSAFVALSALPLTPSGKVDRSALPKPSTSRPDLAATFVGPRTNTERAIAAVWCEILQIDSVGIHDPFFDLGGHSLALARIHARLRERLKIDLPLVSLFQHATIASLANAIDEPIAARRAIPDPTARQPLGPNEPIAVIGMAGRFPGANDVEALWSNLLAGKTSIATFTENELRDSGVPLSIIANPDYVRARGILNDADGFDAHFFGYQSREAEQTDPQQRLFLEIAWAALENAGYVPERCAGRVGVFAGASLNTYLLNNVLSADDARERFLSEFQSAGYGILVGNDKDYLATRVAYKLNLHGPAVSIQTACSTSLVAIIQAIESLRSGQCDLALAGGVSITFPQQRGSLYQEGAITSRDGHCRPFDADATGTVFGDGVGIVVLKRLTDAIADSDSIYAVVRGVGLSNDGADKVSFVAPSVEGQVDAISRALSQAGFDPDSVGYVEAHGTGTPMGDPIEVAALSRVFPRRGSGHCWLGSIKGNVGHLEAAAGVAGFIKAARCLHHKQIPATAHFQRPNAALQLENSAFRVAAQTAEWQSDLPRRAGVTSLGVGGTNAHVLLEEAPLQSESGPTWPWQLLLSSARTPQALDAASERLARHLETIRKPCHADIAYTLQVGRRAFEHRRFVIANSCADAAAALRTANAERVFTRGPVHDVPKVLFLFPGQGTQFLGMAQGLYHAEPTFRATIDFCAECLASIIDFDIRQFLLGENTDDRLAAAINETRFTQPVLFAIEYALAQMWRGWGVQPAALFGHSIGEFVAACLADVLSLEDSLMLVAARGQYIWECAPGSMVAVRACEGDVRSILPQNLDIAAVNSARQTVVSGPVEAVERFEHELSRRNITYKRLTTSHGFHSASLDPAIVRLRETLRKVSLRVPTIPFVSCVSGDWITDAEATSADYWAEQLRRPVRCLQALQTLSSKSAYVSLEVGPGATLSNLLRQSATMERVIDAIGGLTSATEPGDVPNILASLGRLWLAGVEVEWEKFHALSKRRRVSLPTYPFQRKRFWIEPAARIPESQTALAQNALTVAEPSVADLPASDALVLTEIQALLAELSGSSVEAMAPNANFFDLGFDSLFLTQAVQAIQIRFGVKVTFRQLLESLNTAAALAEFIVGQKPAAAADAIPVASQPNLSSSDATTGFGSLVPIEAVTEVDWSPRQLSFLRQFVARYVKRTVRSKQHVQNHRREHADPRTVSGFNRLWKEMVYPIVVERSAGARLWDVDGNEYIDLLNGFGPDLLGHSPPIVVQAIERQLKTGYEVGPMSPLAGELASLVCELTGLDRASFVCTGSEAVQAALRAARTVTGRDQVVTFSRDYHGNFDEVLLRGGTQSTMPSAPGIPGTAVSQMIVLDYGSSEALKTIREVGSRLAAVLVEPVQSRRPEWQPVEFLRELRQITESTGACLIFDEVITGFRLHPGGAQALFGVRADLATYGKIVGGGMPIGVVAGRANFMNAFDGGFWIYGDNSIPEAGRTFFAGTFVRHPLALAAGLATLRYLRERGPGLQARLNQSANELVVQLQSIVRQHGVPLEVVNCGSLLFFRVLNGSKDASLLFYLLRERGIYLLEGFPSYLNTAHTEADFQHIVQSFAAAIAEMRAHGFFDVDVLPRECNDGWLPLTDSQKELWITAQHGDDASRSFNESCTLRLSGPLNESAFREAARQVVQRHQALRAQFDSSGRGQKFLESVPVDVPIIDLSSFAPEDRERRLASLQDVEDQFVFDLASGPIFRIRIVRLGSEDHAILLTVHHLACDGWSYDIILHDLGALYTCAVVNEPCPLSEPARYDVFAKSLVARDTSKSLGYWTKRFAEPVAPLELPTDRPRSSRRSFRGGRVTRSLGVDRSQRIRTAAAHLNCTPYVLTLAAYNAFLCRLSSQSDIVVGIPVAGQAVGQLPTLVGHCVNFLPLRQFVDVGVSFADLCESVKQNVLDAFEHQDFTLVQLLESLPNLDANRQLTAVGFNLDPPLRDLGLVDLLVQVHKNPKHFTHLELHWNLVDGGTEYELDAEFNSDLFEEETIERWIDGYFELLDDAVNATRTAVSELRILPPAERRRLLIDWNDTRRAIPDMTVAELFERQARERPDSPALVFQSTTMSYGELNERADDLARVLQSRGVGPDMPVPVLLDRSPTLIAALLGILKAGGAYLPLDPSHPVTRNRQLIHSARASMLVSDSSQYQAQQLGLDFIDAASRDRGSLPPIARQTNADHLAAIMYTSGSTGTPKGVMVTHRGIVRLLFASGYCDFGPEHCTALLAPVAFDAVTFELWGALLHGGCLAIYPDPIPDPDTLGPFLKRHKVDILWLTAGLFNAVIDRDPEILSGVRQLFTGGEAMSLAHARRALAALPNTKITNGYGPTETTTFATTFALSSLLPESSTSVPIGHPIGNTTAVVLDRLRHPVPVGVHGELYIGGAGVARGYLNAPELTLERFIPSPLPEIQGTLYQTGDIVRWRADGTLDYLGRTDEQVKIRGHRIEPGEATTVLAGHPDVASAAVVAIGSGPNTRLVGYVVLKDGRPKNPVPLREFLAERLPTFLVPSAFVFVDQLPITPNGKLDRAALHAPELASQNLPKQRVAPRTDAERDILRVWSDVLREPEIGVTENFFEVGGHSLKAVELVAAIRDRLGHALPLSALYEAPTVEQLAAVIQNKLEAGSCHNLVPLREKGSRPPLFMVAGVGGHVFAFHKFARLLGGDQPCYGVKAIGVDGTRPPPERVEDIAAEYVREIVETRPNGALVMAGYSLGAVIAFEVALQLHALGREVPLLIAYDAAAPGYLSYPVLKRMQLHFANLFLRGGGWGYVRQRLRNLKDKFNWAIGRGERNAPEIPGLEMFSQEAITQVWVALHKAYKQYTPGARFTGDITVIRADLVEDWDKFVSNDPLLGWGKWTHGRVAAHGLPVRHLDLFHEPAIHDLTKLTEVAIGHCG